MLLWSCMLVLIIFWGQITTVWSRSLNKFIMFIFNMNIYLDIYFNPLDHLWEDIIDIFYRPDTGSDSGVSTDSSNIQSQMTKLSENTLKFPSCSIRYDNMLRSFIVHTSNHLLYIAKISIWFDWYRLHIIEHMVLVMDDSWLKKLE